MKQLLIYPSTDFLEIKDFCVFLEAKDIIYSVVKDDEVYNVVDTLFSDTNKIGPCSTTQTFTFLLFKNFAQEDILSFLKEAAFQHFNFFHKAALTEHNASWTLHDLMIEIEEEHAFFTQWQYLHSLLKGANECDSSLYTKSSYEAYKDSFLKAYMFTKAPTKEGLDGIISNLQEALRNLTPL